MEEQNRQFKGIWIPKEIWLCKNLSFQEKIILVEIDSYDDGKIGCYASNKHFVSNFGMTASRVSQIIQSLQEKQYIKINYEYNGKEIQRRYLHINRPPYPDRGMLKNDIPMLKNEIVVCQFDKQGYVKKLKDNNTYINNTINNKKVGNFKKPTIEEIQQYIDERKNGINANAFYDFYESKDWMIGKNKMKDWKACVRTWEQKNKPNSKTLPSWYNKEIKNIEIINNDEFNNFIKEFRNG